MNKNCLQGIRCPNTGCMDRESVFRISVTTMVLMLDSGSELPDSDLVWNEDSGIICNCCGKDGTVKEFKDLRHPKGTKVRVVKNTEDGLDQWAIGKTGKVFSVDENDYYEVHLDDVVTDNDSYQFAHYQLEKL